MPGTTSRASATGRKAHLYIGCARNGSGVRWEGFWLHPITSVVLLKLPNRKRSASEHCVYAFSMTANPAQMNR